MDDPPDSRSRPPSRQAREAAALRANLLKRKAQARDRAAAQGRDGADEGGGMAGGRDGEGAGGDG
jgi:hypothetical protein